MSIDRIAEEDSEPGEPSAIELAVEAAGGRAAMAEKCGVRYQAVEKWERLNRVPAERVLQIEAAAGGKVTRHMLRPDLYPLPAPHDSAALRA